ncbi:hypothetical protein [Planctomycetes bacterium K23_9]|uniref:Uncharacterized protein n=1 Tax=Stieleria marina TaxID=1930275 RepID=A0A517NV68_9BACT|nr:hypothetical protein K239x_30060 [Planctomycetes bacterium K23_9]
MKYLRCRFTLKRVFVATASIACLLAARSLCYSHATIQIRDIRDDLGSTLDVTYFSDFDHGCVGGNAQIPRLAGGADFSELAGTKWSTAYRPHDFLWMNANHHQVIEMEMASAFGDYASSH